MALKPDNVVPVSGLDVPPLVVMTINLRKTVKPKTSENEICMISCLVHHEFPLNKAVPDPPFQIPFCGECLYLQLHPRDVCKVKAQIIIEHCCASCRNCLIPGLRLLWIITVYMRFALTTVPFFFFLFFLPSSFSYLD